MKRILLLSILITASLIAEGQAVTGHYDWVKFFAGYERDYYPSQGIYCTEVDDSGYVYYYGSFGDVCTQGLYGLEGRFDTTLTEEMYRQGKYN
ncbi:MAG: hypothetical protein IJM74_10175, partial [Bacteroidales bacterium]|nr:hypothetical protein [Bacteroidales bacterium]